MKETSSGRLSSWFLLETLTVGFHLEENHIPVKCELQQKKQVFKFGKKTIFEILVLNFKIEMGVKATPKLVVTREIKFVLIC